MLPRLWTWFWSLAGRVSILVKIMGIVVVVALAQGLAVAWYVGHNLAASLDDVLAQRGIAVGSGLAKQAADYMLIDDIFELYRLARGALQADGDIRYVYLEDATGRVVVHTFGATFPTDLLRVNRPKGGASSAVSLDTAEGRLIDVMVPILEGEGGSVHVGLSTAGAGAAIGKHIRFISIAMSLALVPGMALAYLLATVITRALGGVVRAADAVGRGDFSTQPVLVWATDEIGRLAAAFNQMTERLLDMAVENARLWEDLKEREETKGRLLDRVIAAQEDERRRVAQELHDEVGQSLTSVLVELRALELAEDRAALATKVAQLRRLVAGLVRTVQHIALELRPSMLDDLGLVPALGRYIQEYGTRHGIMVDFQTTGVDSLRLKPSAETALYRIIQEALTNVARHAAASSVSVVLARRNEGVVAIVEDDGMGFDVAKVTERRAASLGLRGMEERASLAGGHLVLESQPGQGASVFVEVPLAGNMGRDRSGG